MGSKYAGDSYYGEGGASFGTGGGGRGGGDVGCSCGGLSVQWGVLCWVIDLDLSTT